MRSVMWVFIGFLVVVLAYGCSDQFGVISMMLADTVAPVVEITSHVDGDEYLPDIIRREEVFEAGSPLRDLDAVFINVTVVEKTSEGVRGTINKMRVDVIGYPELSGSWNGFYPNDGDERAGFSDIGYDEFTADPLYASTFSFVVFFDNSPLSGNITVRISSEDWNGNVGTAEVNLVPPTSI